MTTLAKIIVTLMASLFFTSCYFENLAGGKRGNGNVVTENRDLPETITEIKASEGLDVYITQSNQASLTVEADENIIDLIRTDTSDDRLHIHAEKPIGKSRSKKIYVSLPNITLLQTSSGADMESTDVIKTDLLELQASSGSDLTIRAEANEITCNTSSGADINISGSATSLRAAASSGSDINAGSLYTEDCTARVSSGADIVVHATGKVTFQRSSGGKIVNKAHSSPSQK